MYAVTLIQCNSFSCSNGFDESPTVIGNVQCTGDNTSQVLLQCDTSRDYGSFCSDNYDVTVSCCKYIIIIII